MDAVTRRRFLLAAGGVTAAAMADAALGLTWSSLHRAGEQRPADVGQRVLVVLTLYGGNDGINTVVPWSDPAYRDARAELAYDDADVLHLDEHFALNPAMTGIKSMWDDQRVAIVHGVGYPQPDRSHFRSMDIWQTASPDTPVRTGWLGRWLDATGDDPLRAVAIGSVLPPLAVGARCTAATLTPGPFQPLPAAAAGVARALAVERAADSVATADVVRACSATGTAEHTFGRALGGVELSDSDGPLGAQLASVAAAINAKVPTSVWAVSLGGFDTHADEKGTQQALWSSVDAAIAAFFKALRVDAQPVTVMIHSEFGRRVGANASQGTDHGTAGPVFVAGVPVRGGFYGTEPSLTDLDDGDLKASTDFRVIYSELVGKVLGTDPGKVLGTERPALGLIA